MAKTPQAKIRKVVSLRTARTKHRTATGKINGASIVLEEARRAGLLSGHKTEHVSFRAPKALIEAAKRGSGARKPTELGLLALAMLAQPDPAAEFLKKTRGKLGADHKLEY
jgi:hypothetical protein